MHSIKSALAEAVDTLTSVSDSPLLDAEVLLCQALNKPRSHLRAWPDQQLQPEQLSAFKTLLEQRQKGTPIAYITGNREFWSRDFQVTPDVLIPRPDTELLIELSLKLIPADEPVNVIDLGTGSGIIAITLAAERPLAQISATDFSLAALRIAQLNADKHQINNIEFYQSDWFADVPDTKFNLIISNPPYIAEDDSHLQQGDVRFEPKTALSAAEQGLGDIKIIADIARRYLKPCGHLLIEHGYNQQQQIQILFKDLHYENVQTYTDLSGQPRVTYGQWNSC
ncbi:peptide chain release factor N(5)-glutamine methyltransferase [Methylobacter sp.]|uniref:peptide chain release factor N(5)-glutamine methyltransferase n=1 Tax=Methylobacter sp. TaxID=2051955 RepID=UPI0012179238|nr:peptide chain release factor N(5)-glutamine methyltransferase [Methylobacter sp.]TAK60415.1 MAG: peptide chain release factor N(5)-glutamine methyltransferase [Methylobacter sp.]